MSASIAYDPADHYTVLFGGGQHINLVSYSDTWTYSGGAWTKVTVTPAPIGRIGAGLVYDARDGYLLLFGGYNESRAQFLSDTWAFSGGHWTLLSPAFPPPPRWLFGMDYDTSAQKVVLFGGGSFAPLGDTWTYAAGNWTLLAPSTTPPWRSDFQMAYDPTDRESVLFGGNANGSVLSDTWTFASARWTKATPVLSPPAQQDLGLAFDPVLPAVVLASGGFATASTSPVTWSFSNGIWQNLSSRVVASYPFRHHQTLAWDGSDGYLLMFGGVGSSGFLSETWLFDVLNITGPQPPYTVEIPFELPVNATVTGGIPPIAVQWSLSDGSVLQKANGSIAVTTAGSWTLNLSVRDRAGLSQFEGPFPVRALPPLAVSTGSDTATGTAPLSVRFSAIATGGSSPYAFRWTFGDGANGSGANVTHDYPNAGKFLVTVHTTDGLQRTANGTLNITVRAPPAGGNSTTGSLPAYELYALAGGGAGIAAIAIALAIRSRRARKPHRPEAPRPGN